MEKYTYDVAENFIRGFLKLFPAGSGISDMIFAMKDAREKQMLEESMDFFENRIRNISIIQTKNHEDIEHALLKLGDKLDSVIDDYLLFLKQNDFIKREMYLNIMVSLSNTNSKIENIDFKLDDIKKLLTEKQNKDNESFKNIFNNYLSKLVQQISEYEIIGTLAEIKQLKNTDGFNDLNDDFRFSLNALEGQIHLKLGNMDDAESIFHLFKAKDYYNERMCNFLIYYATVTSDHDLKEEVMTIYSKIGVDRSKSVIREAFFYLNLNQYNSAQSLISDEKNGNLYIKNELIENEESYYLLGMINFYQKKYEEAESYLSISYRKKEVLVTKYFIYLSQVYKIIDYHSAFYIITETERAKLKEIYNKFTSESLFIKKFKDIPGLFVDYWLQRLTIVFHFDSVKALDELNNIPTTIKTNSNIKILEADILFFNQQHGKARDILTNIYQQNKNSELLSRILGTLIKQEEYDEVIKLFDALSPSEYDKGGLIISLYLDALQHKIDTISLLNKAKALIALVPEPIYPYRFLGRYFLNQRDETKAKEYFALSNKAISADDFNPRLLFTQDYFQMKFYDLGFDCIIPLVPYNYEAKKLFVQFALREDLERHMELVEKIIENELSTNTDYIFWCSIKAELEYYKKRFNTALKYAEIVFRKRRDEDSAYRYTYLKLNTNKFEFGEELNLLEMSKNPIFLMIAATCHNSTGNNIKCEFLSLKALAVNGNKPDINLFSQFIRNLLFPTSGEDEKVEFNVINSNCAVKLVCGDKDLWIGITSDKSLLIEEKQYNFLDTKFYYSRHSDIIKYIGLSKSDEVYFEDCAWIVDEILALKTHAIRYILSYFDEIKPEQKYLQKIPLDPEYPLDSIKPTLIKLELHEKNILSMYNLNNELGLSLNMLAKSMGKNIFDVIIHLFNMQNQPFFAGEVNNYELAQSSFILTSSSIALLSLMGDLEKVVEKFPNLVISESTFKYFEDIILHHDDFETKSRMSVGIDGGKIYAQNYERDFHKNRRKFFVDTLSAIEKVARIDLEISTEELDDFNMLLTFISKNEYDSLKIASDKNFVHVSDDLFVRRARQIIGQNIRSTNSISLIFSLYKNDLKGLFVILEKLSKSKYTYIFNEHILQHVVSELLNNFSIVGPESYYEKFINIVHNTLTVQITFNVQMTFLLGVFNYLYTLRYTANADYLIEKLFKIVAFFMTIHNVDEKIFSDYLYTVFGSDRDRMEYFSSILKSIK
ncbi:MAG: hypothetical protein SCALA702_01710 [Melioribacteraceae bacterium]|nr:MAG: hypothetical protein SCALA702_01710 [Melioribacteraceae bacterium]